MRGAQGFTELQGEEKRRELQGEEKREEGGRGDQEKRGNLREESNLASNQFPMCCPESGTLREVHRVI